MKQAIKDFLRGLFCENGTPSRTGLAAFMLIIVPLFSAVFLTIYLALNEKTFTYYQGFVDLTEWLITVGCGLLGYNKFIIVRANWLDSLEKNHKESNNK